MKVKVISVLEDNYMYLVIEESTRDAVAVDAAVPKRLLEIVRKEDVVLRAILTTHHHWDHARGNEELARLCPGLRVYGADERIGALTHKVTHDQELTVRGRRTAGPHGSCPTGRPRLARCRAGGEWSWEMAQSPAVRHRAGVERGGCPDTGCCTAQHGVPADKPRVPQQPPGTRMCPPHCPSWRGGGSPSRPPRSQQSWSPCREEPLQKFTGKTDPVEVLRTLRTEKDNFKKPKERPNPQAMLAFDWGLFSPFLEEK
ncbi:HAGHL protein, partial [Fregetta grallaria]|nr:HAGHL protein [Fregetta grallaria]